MNWASVLWYPGNRRDRVVACLGLNPDWERLTHAAGGCGWGENSSSQGSSEGKRILQGVVLPPYTHRTIARCSCTYNTIVGGTGLWIVLSRGMGGGLFSRDWGLAGSVSSSRRLISLNKHLPVHPCTSFQFSSRDSSLSHTSGPPRLGRREVKREGEPCHPCTSAIFATCGLEMA